LLRRACIAPYRPGGFRGWPVCPVALRVLSPDSGAGDRLRRAGATQVNWAYALSGVLAVLLLLYLLVALIWAEDL
jgi:K+-transporting ATPase KdpF subunit